MPVAVGFGIGTPGAGGAVGAVADGVIVGTRLVRAVAEADGPAACGATPSASSSAPLGRAIDERRGRLSGRFRAVRLSSSPSSA